MKISVYGDSISTFSGLSNNSVTGQDTSYYNKDNFNDCYNTWWMRVIGNKPNGALLCNEAISETEVGYYYYNKDRKKPIISDEHHKGLAWCMNNPKRINTLGGVVGQSNHPDAILFFGGTNDAILSNDHYEGELFFENYANALRLMGSRFGSTTQIVCVTPYRSPLTDECEHLDDVCDKIIYACQQGYANCIAVDLRNTNMYESVAVDATCHPTNIGMERIANAILEVWK